MKRLLYLTLFSLCSVAASAQQLHVVYVLEQDDVRMGLINLRNDTLITDMVHTIRRGLNFSMTIRRLARNNFTTASIRETLAKLSTKPQDVVIVYYSGYGLAPARPTGQFANWKLNDKPEQGLPVDSVATWVQAKSAHLGLIIADYSPESVKAYTRAAMMGRTIDLSREVLRQLFVRNCGLVLFGSALPSKPSFMRVGNPETGVVPEMEEISGSAFATGLTGALNKLCTINPIELPTLSYKTWKSRTQSYINSSIGDPYEQQIVLEERLCPAMLANGRPPTMQPVNNNRLANESFIQSSDAVSAAARWQGLLINEEAYGNLPQKTTAFNLNRLPARKDLSAYAPPILDQGDKATCVAISIGYYMRSILEARRRNLTNKAEILKLSYSPFYLYNQVKDPEDRDCAFGIDAGLVLEYLKNNGLPFFSNSRFQDPNLCLNDRPNPQYARPSARIMDYAKLFRITEDEAAKIQSTKQALAENAPVVVGIQTTNSMQELAFRRTALKELGRSIQELFSDDGSTRTATTWKPFDANSLSFGHAMCVVGYDDTILNGKGAFKIINSWGKLWGDDGYFWMSYENFGQFAKYGYQAYLPPKDVTPSLDVDLTFFRGISQTDPLPSRPQKLPNGYTGYALTQPMQTGDKFKFSVRANRPTYLYVIASSATTDTTQQLLPLKGYKLLIPANKQWFYPQDEFWRPEGRPGKEFLLFLFSSIEIPARVLEKYRQYGGERENKFPRRLDPMLDSAIQVQAKEIGYKPKKIGFFVSNQYLSSLPGSISSVISNETIPFGWVVPILVTIDHQQ